MAYEKKELTTAFGIAVRDDRNFTNSGVRGPALMQDAYPIGKLSHFDR